MVAIHNGVDARLYAPNAEWRAEARREFGYDESDLVCGIAARLVRDKGHAFLFRAAAQVRNRLPQLRLLVLGQGPLDEELRGLADALGIGDRVHFAGFRKDMARCVQAMDIGIQPSIDCDTSSFSLKEQMACGKAVIASDYGGLKEIVRDGVEGIVVPAGTVDPLATAIERLAAEPEMRRTMGAAGRARVLREFTVEHFAESTIEAYRRAIEVFHERPASR